ncbi:MAG: hypothetical protein ACLU4P_05845 [Ruminococcus sp.]
MVPATTKPDTAGGNTGSWVHCYPSTASEYTVETDMVLSGSIPVTMRAGCLRAALTVL